MINGFSKQYNIIYADPPWNEHGSGQIKRGANRHYPLMTTRQIIALPVRSLTAPNAHLYLWTTNNFLPDALQVMTAWGFEYKTMVTWVKDGAPGLGQYFRGQTEHCLFGVKGMIPYKVEDGKRQQGVTYFYAPRTAHSEKPEEMRRMIEKVSTGEKLELFARKKSEGWDVFGNEVSDSILLKEHKAATLFN